GSPGRCGECYRMPLGEMRGPADGGARDGELPRASRHAVEVDADLGNLRGSGATAAGGLTRRRLGGKALRFVVDVAVGRIAFLIAEREYPQLHRRVEPAL